MKKIGFSSHCFSRALPIEEVIGFCLDKGFNAMELNVDQTTFNPEIVKRDTVRWVRTIGESGKVRFSMHGPEDVNFAAETPEAREDAVQRTEAAIALAAEMGIAVVVTHPGRTNAAGNRESFEEARENTIAALRRCAETATDLGVALSVENLCHVKGTVAPDIQSFLEMCRRIDLSTIAVTLDTGHSFVDGLGETLDAVGKYLNHIHIDDNSA
jgi:sugar phosphate isomerase/epimerase